MPQFEIPSLWIFNQLLAESQYLLTQTDNFDLDVSDRISTAKFKKMIKREVAAHKRLIRYCKKHESELLKQLDELIPKRIETDERRLRGTETVGDAQGNAPESR